MRLSLTSLWSSPNMVYLVFFSCKKLVKTRKVCDLCLFLHKISCKIVWKFCEIWIFYGNCLSDWPNSVRFYLSVWDMACMSCIPIFMPPTSKKLEGHPQLQRSWRGILLLGHSSICSSHFLMHSITLEQCMLLFWNFLYGFLMKK